MPDDALCEAGQYGRQPSDSLAADNREGARSSRGARIHACASNAGQSSRVDRPWLILHHASWDRCGVLHSETTIARFQRVEFFTRMGASSRSALLLLVE